MHHLHLTHTQVLLPLCCSCCRCVDTTTAAAAAAAVAADTRLFCMTITTPCRMAQNRKVCAERATVGESTGRLSISMAVPMDQ